MSQLYDEDMGTQRIDVSASTRKFQTSIIITQDPDKNGILSFLETVEQEVSQPLANQSAPNGGSSAGSSGGGSYS